jgi:hypothetical protein
VLRFSKLCASPYSATQFAPLRTPRARVNRYIFQGGAIRARGIWSDNMLSVDRRACATLALMALVSLAGIAPADARSEPQQRHEHRPSGGARPAARRETEARQSRRTQAARPQAARATAGREATHVREYPAASYHPNTPARSVNERRLGGGSATRNTPVAAGARVREVSHGSARNQVHVVRYGNTLSGTVERTIRPGLMSRTFVSGGHVLYTHVYQSHVWHQFGRAFAYETFVPPMRYPAVYYGWALGAWPHPLVYAWGWQVQPWYPMYGALFTPYPVYTSPDLWMTDYIIAQSMQAAYQAQTPAPAAAPSPPEAPVAPAAESDVGAPPAQPNDVSPATPPIDAPPSPQPGDVPQPPQPSVMPAAPTSLPPAVTPQVKAQLDAQIKVQLREQQAAVATPETVTTTSTPPALRPNHVFFEVVQPLEVPSAAANRSCTLSANDYIKRTGGMSQDDWKIPVVVELSGPSDCPQGLHTRIGLNDLNAMENEQEARVMEAMDAASKHLGPNGPPSGAGAHPTLIAAGNAAPDPMALDAIRQAQ